jgi:hypothetical protein
LYLKIKENQWIPQILSGFKQTTMNLFLSETSMQPSKKKKRKMTMQTKK